tara:strand:- start:129 stop:347 length:219 start_codon:yes stop_codon:yes gene_type:complete
VIEDGGMIFVYSGEFKRWDIIIEVFGGCDDGHGMRSDDMRCDKSAAISEQEKAYTWKSVHVVFKSIFVENKK